MRTKIVGWAQRPDWTEIERPIGPQELPSWVLGLHIDWAMQFANAPRVKFKVAFDPMPKDVLWQQGPNGRWFREHDGIIGQLWNGGALTQMPNGEWETTRTEGHGGRTSTLKMVDGRVVHLRGSWFGGCPEGYNELTMVDMSDPHNQTMQGRVTYEWVPGKKIHKILKAEAWFKKGGTYGLYVPDDVLIKAIAKYWPHVRIAQTKGFNDVDFKGCRIEPFLDEWNAPKSYRK